MRHFIKGIIKGVLKPKINPEYDTLFSELDKIYGDAPVDFGGGCSIQKALTMAAFIKEFNYAKTVDIGVYRGRSLFPQALAHKLYTGGIAYGVDPYTKKDAVQNDRPDLKQLLDNFLQITDFETIYNHVSDLIRKNKFEGNCKLVRQTSGDAKDYFIHNNIRFGLVHIDGNHDTSFVLQDIHDYFPLVEDGGVIVMDDVSWTPVQPALKLLKSKSILVGEITNPQNDFAVLLKNGTKEQVSIAKKLFRNVIRYK